MYSRCILTNANIHNEIESKLFLVFGNTLKLFADVNISRLLINSQPNTANELE